MTVSSYTVNGQHLLSTYCVARRCSLGTELPSTQPTLGGRQDDDAPATQGSGAQGHRLACLQNFLCPGRSSFFALHRPHPDLSPLPNSSLFGGRLRKETLLLASRSLSVAVDGPRSPHLRSVRHLQACPHTGLCLPSRSRDGQACAAGPELLRAEAAASHLGEEGSTRRL